MGHTEDYREPEVDYYVDRDPWYTQSQLGRPCPETLWGHRMAMPRSVPALNAVPVPAYPAPADPVPMEGDLIRGARCHPIPLHVPDVALRGQQLLAYGERLLQEETEAGIIL